MQGLGLLKYEDLGFGITCEKIKGKKDISKSLDFYFLVFIYCLKKMLKLEILLTKL